MFIHKQLGAEDRRHMTVSTDSRTTTNASLLLTGSTPAATAAAVSQRLTYVEVAPLMTTRFGEVR